MSVPIFPLVRYASRSKKNLFDLLFKEPDKGIGKKVTRRIWHRPDCYWTITRIEFTARGPDRHKRGKVYGYLTWRGVEENLEKRIRGSDKQEWRYYDPEYYKRFEDTNTYLQNQHLSGGVHFVNTDPGTDIGWDALQIGPWVRKWQTIIRKEMEEEKRAKLSSGREESKPSIEEEVAKEKLD